MHIFFPAIWAVGSAGSSCPLQVTKQQTKSVVSHYLTNNKQQGSETGSLNQNYNRKIYSY